jgi:GT2 family glycosyltransferase
MCMDLSIIIVNYQTYDLTKQAIKSIIDQDHPFSYEIFLVDNNSQDGSFEKLEEDFKKQSANGLINFIKNSHNNGFANANNLALKKSNSKYVLLLNSDTLVVDDCLAKCINYMEKDEGIGALGCKVLLPDGSLDKACRRSFPTFSVSFYHMTGLSRLFPKSKRFGQYNLTYLDENKIYPVDCLTGAFMMVRSEVVHSVGLLDEDFFMYGEDIDWCYRIKASNWKILYYSGAEIVHFKGSSSQKNQLKLTVEFYKAMYTFYNKHYKSQYPWIITFITYLGIGAICGMCILGIFFNKIVSSVSAA